MSGFFFLKQKATDTLRFKLTSFSTAETWTWVCLYRVCSRAAVDVVCSASLFKPPCILFMNTVHVAGLGKLPSFLFAYTDLTCMVIFKKKTAEFYLSLLESESTHQRTTKTIIRMRVTAAADEKQIMMNITVENRHLLQTNSPHLYTLLSSVDNLGKLTVLSLFTSYIHPNENFSHVVVVRDVAYVQSCILFRHWFSKN